MSSGGSGGGGGVCACVCVCLAAVDFVVPSDVKERREKFGKRERTLEPN